MSNPPENPGGGTSEPARIPALSKAGDSASSLLPVKPQATIEEIVAEVQALGSPRVELLVPNNTKALQSLAGCEMLRRSLTAVGIYTTLFTSDEKTAAAARIAKLDVVAVGGAIVAPSDDHPRPRPSRQIQVPPARLSQLAGSEARTAPRPDIQSRPAPLQTRQSGSAAPASGPSQARTIPRRVSPVRPSAEGPPQGAPNAGQTLPLPTPAPSDDAFLAGLEAFDRAQSIRGPAGGETLPTSEGAVLFDAPGDLGVPRPDAAGQDAWESAFEDMGATMAAEPGPPGPARRRSAPDTIGGNGQPPRRAVLGPFAPLLARRPRRAAKSAFAGLLMQRSQRSPEEAVLRTRQSRRLLLWPLALLGLLILITGAWVATRTFGVLPGSATITLTAPAPKSDAQSFTGLAIPVRDQPITDQSSFEVQGALLEQPVSVTVQGQAISTTLTPIGRATGVIFLRNTLSQPVVVRAGTVVPAATGVQFTVQADTTVPAAAATADGITFGRGQANLRAVVPGGGGNIPPGSITAIPGFEGTLRVEQGQFAGGSDQEVHIVRTEDVNRVLPDAVSQLYGTGIRALQIKLADRSDFSLVTPTITPTLESLQQLRGIDYGVFPPLGGVAPDGTFKLEVRGLFRGVAEPANAPLAQQLPKAVRNQLVNTGRIDGNAQVQIKSFTAGTQGLIVDAAVTPSAKAPQLPQSLLDEVQAAIAGKRRNEAVNYLQSLVKEGKIAGYAPLPAQWETVPTRVSVKQATQ